MSTLILFSAPYFEAAALSIASAIAERTISLSIAFSLATASAICNNSNRLALIPVGDIMISFHKTN